MSGFPKPRERAPTIETQDARGEPFSLEALRGRKVVLVFLRHLGCPICRMEIAAWKRRTAEFTEAGADVVVFVESPDDSVRAFAQRADVPFHLIGDPDRRFYSAYGVSKGTLASFLAPGAAKRALKALLRGHAHGRFEGSELQLPADFVVGEDGNIVFARLGRHIGDNTPIDTLLAIVRGAASSQGSAPRMHRRAFLVTGVGAAGFVAVGSGAVAYYNHAVEHVPDYPPDQVLALAGGATNGLFQAYPDLKGRLPWMPMGVHATPVEELPLPDGASGCRLFVKRDDLTHSLYGGNKVRKLEHLLAEAKLAERKTLVTVGGLGSNQALATSLHGRQHGFQVDLCLFDQPITPHVLDNLLADVQAGARLIYGGGYITTALRGAHDYWQRCADGQAPYYIPAGATTPLGNVGYVTAALELAQQVRAGLLPEPDVLFVAAGSCGTAGGLIAGLKLVGLKTRVVAVRITDSIVANKINIRQQAQKTLDLLRRFDPQIPPIRIAAQDFDLETRFFGGTYGAPTPEAKKAQAWVAPRLKVETTYTAKALAACLDHCRRYSGSGQTALFWNTFNSAPVVQAQPAALPPEFRFVLGTPVKGT